MIKFKLDKLLKELNISQTKFANIAGVRPNTINDMCNGITKRLEISTLNQIMGALNQISKTKVNLSDLIEYLGEENGSS